MAVLAGDVAEAMESLMFERGIKDDDGDGCPDDGEMYGGDLLKFQWEAVVRAARNKGRWLPASYNIDSPFQLVPPSIADTTDRTLEFRSKPRGFDNDGFAASAPLQKDLFYWSPYMTCEHCNELIFIDVPNARKMHAAEVRLLI